MAKASRDISVYCNLSQKWYVVAIVVGRISHRTTISIIHRVKWRHSNLWSQYDLYVVGNTTYCVKLSGEDFSLYADKIESVGLRTRAQQFVKRFALALSDRCLSVLSCPVCDVRALWPNGWTDQGETWLAGRPRPWPHCIRWGSSSPSLKGAQPPPNFRPISVAAKWLHGSRCHLVWS